MVMIFSPHTEPNTAVCYLFTLGLHTADMLDLPTSHYVAFIPVYGITYVIAKESLLRASFIVELHCDIVLNMHYCSSGGFRISRWGRRPIGGAADL